MSLNFDGTDDQVNHGDIAAFDGASLACAMGWINPNTLEADSGYWGKGTTAGDTWHLGADGVNNSMLQADITVAGSGRRGSTPAGALVIGTWVHATWWYDGGQVGDARVRVYVNGISQVLTHSGGGSYPATLPNLLAFLTGTGGVGFQDCRLALVKGWAGAVPTDGEILQEMNSYRPVRAANLVIWSPYDDGTSARDYSSAGNHGTVTGALAAAGPPVSYGAPAHAY